MTREPAEFWAFMGVACAVAVIVALLLTACQQPLRSAEYLAQRLVRIESDDARQLKEFNHVDPALPTLNAGDPGLILPHPLGDIGLT
jgi:hypothetical protein